MISFDKRAHIVDIIDSLTFTRLLKLTTYYAMDHPRPAYDYDCAGNMTAYDGYAENDYAIDSPRNEGHYGEDRYDDDVDVYAS